MARDYYGLLGVSKGASDTEIKRAYRKLARELHPDVNPDEAAQARFQEVKVAYEVLIDPEKRRIVDLGGDPMENARRRPVTASADSAVSATSSRRSSAAGAAIARPDRPGAAGLRLAAADAARPDECATGVTKQVTVDTAILCDLCQGKGTHGDSAPIACDTCGGHGEVQTVQRSLLGQVMTSRPCPVCRGVGEVIPDPCHRCGGDGRVRARREISVKIPAGVGDGMRVRLAAQGEVGPGGGPAGDLYVDVHEQPHDVFVRDGDDLHCTVSVPMVDAALGTTVTVDAILDGPTEITVPPRHAARRGHHAARPRHAAPAVRGARQPARPRRRRGALPPRPPGHRAAAQAEDASRPRRGRGEVHPVAAAAGGGLFSRLRETFTGR